MYMYLHIRGIGAEVKRKPQPALTIDGKDTL